MAQLVDENIVAVGHEGFFVTFQGAIAHYAVAG